LINAAFPADLAGGWVAGWGATRHFPPDGQIEPEHLLEGQRTIQIVDPNAASIPATIAALKANDIAITQGPVSFGEGGHVSVFIRDADRNVIELRSPDQGEVEGASRYVP
jgi:catechol 2,3-dioxygenase-like lactoylglutathione lyase family enzyme